jgi:hypothetical protein
MGQPRSLFSYTPNSILSAGGDGKIMSKLESDTTPDFIEWLNEAIDRSKEDVRDNCRDINSYGSGYDMGRRDALEAVRSYLNGDKDA